MDLFKIMSPLGGDFLFSDTVPTDIPYEPIPGATPWSLYGPWGWAVFQQLTAGGLSFWDSQYYAACDVTLTGSTDRPLLELNAFTDNAFDSPWPSGSFTTMPWVENNTAVLRKGQFYRTGDLHFERPVLLPYLDAYPKLYDLLNHTEKNQVASIDRQLKLDGNLRAMISSIRRLNCNPAIRDRYFTIKAEEYLITALDQMHRVRRPPKAFVLTPELKDKAEDLAVKLQSRATERMSLREAARLQGANVMYIWQAFKARYGITIHEYQTRLRLERARELLLRFPDKDLESICVDTQFYDKSHLVNAFRAEYGVTPGEYRRGMGKRG
jgi:AraC-like DNA-binding protein